MLLCQRHALKETEASDLPIEYIIVVYLSNEVSLSAILGHL